MKTFMLDTMIYHNLVSADAGFDLVRLIVDHTHSERMTLLTTYVQLDELAAMGDKTKLAEIQRVFRDLPQQEIPTMVIVAGLSRVGKSRVDDGVVFHAIQSEFNNHTKDALIANTAAHDADVFVTDDRRLRNRFREATDRCEVWSFVEFRQYILSLPLAN
jgi:predicted nucleic acid-binding protein